MIHIKRIDEMSSNSINESKYQIVGYLIDPDAGFQKSQLSHNDYLEAKSDYDAIMNSYESGTIPNGEILSLFDKYKIDNGNIETIMSNDDFVIDTDGDGVYLLKKI